MKWLGIIMLLVVVWMAYEIWRAPLIEEKEDGRMVVKKPTKKLSDLFKKKNKTKQLWMFNSQTASQNHLKD